MYAESWPPEIPNPLPISESERTIWNYEYIPLSEPRIIPSMSRDEEFGIFAKIVQAAWTTQDVIDVSIREQAEAAAFKANIAWLRS